MSLRLIHTNGFCAETSARYKVYRNAEWEEYEVRYFIDGEPLLASCEEDAEPASYHTNDLEDAKATGEAWLAGEWDGEMEKVVGPMESFLHD